MQPPFSSKQDLMIGVGLRHAHFNDVLAGPAPLDFVEVHSENFFGEGGVSRAILSEVSKHYPVSLHSTAMGLGSESAIPDTYLRSLKQLVEHISPVMISDHAAFTWSQLKGSSVHAGDLLPLTYNEENLEQMTRRIVRCQDFLDRRLLVENVSAYLRLDGATLSETEFLTALSEGSGCGLLVDLNNIVVNARNLGIEDIAGYAMAWLDAVPADKVGELHLAGYTAVPPGEIAVDDHARPVSEDVWSLYTYALQRFGPVPTLIEWDNDLPSWQVLVSEAEKARRIAQEVLSHEK